ncbi:MAG: fatty acyl-AMP ligase [Candidatus Eremiobacteraeota bacterium]|nr:fatty acyl-AMP ligase [Candidatus Eremiobacteraeota bacterium]MCW5869266.1 fatty acyl-AMP ligase [Candidatus Eremiobacteraeota bacterium]
MILNGTRHRAFDLLTQARLDRPQHPAFTFLSEGAPASLSWQALHQKALGMAAELTRRGLSGQRALLVFKPGLDFIQNLFACFYANVVAVPVYPPRLSTNNDLFFAVLDDAEPAVVLTESSLKWPLRALLMSRFPKKFRPVLELKECKSSDFSLPNRQPDAPALIQYTSGSTSTPRGVVISESNILSNLKLIHEGAGQGPESVGIHWLPMYHDMGLMSMLYSVYRSFHCVLLSPLDFIRRPQKWLRALSDYRADFSGGPTFGYLLAEKRMKPEEVETLDLSNWKIAYVGAEKVHAGALRKFAARFAPCGFSPTAFYPCYGLAEHTVAVSGGRPDQDYVCTAFEEHSLAAGVGSEVQLFDPRLHQRSVELVGCGTSKTNHQLLIVDPETRQVLPQGVLGEIWPGGPSVAAGYWKKDAQTEAVFQAHTADGRGPFLHTGDLGFLLDQELFVVGRLKDLIIIKGRNLYPEDLELTLSSAHPECRAGCSAAFSVDSEEGEKLVIFQEVRAPLDTATAETVAQSIREILAREHSVAADSVILLKAHSLPKTSSGKVRRSLCRTLFLQKKITGNIHIS